MRAITLIVTVFLLSGLHGLQAQQAVLSSSSNAAGAGGSASYSVGQTAFHTFTGGGAIVTEGIQQPYEILFMDGIETGESLKLECVVYPNPAESYVRLKVSGEKLRDLGYRLFDARGTLLKSGRAGQGETTIPLDELSPATYLLSVIENGNTLQTYRIIKTQGK